MNPPVWLDPVKQTRHHRVLDVARDRERPLHSIGTTLEEAHTLVTWLSLTGVVYPLASVMPKLPKSLRPLRKTLPPLTIVPVDLLSRGTDMQWDRSSTRPKLIHNYPDILDLKVNTAAGLYDVAGVTNWRSGLLHKRVSSPISWASRPAPML